jgi:hypothetical protein
VRVIIGLVAAVLLGLGVAAGATIALSNTAAPDKNVRIDPVGGQKPDPWAGAVNYGKP